MGGACCGASLTRTLLFWGRSFKPRRGGHGLDRLRVRQPVILGFQRLHEVSQLLHLLLQGAEFLTVDHDNTYSLDSIFGEI